jgi:hypothetical protein
LAGVRASERARESARAREREREREPCGSIWQIIHAQIHTRAHAHRRFKHINNVARALLAQHGYSEQQMEAHGKKSSKKGK